MDVVFDAKIVTSSLSININKFYRNRLKYCINDSTCLILRVARQRNFPRHSDLFVLNVWEGKDNISNIFVYFNHFIHISHKVLPNMLFLTT